MFELPKAWDPRRVAINRDEKNTFLLRPGQILVGPGDVAEVAKILPDWKPSERRPFGVTAFTRDTLDAAEIRAALIKVRRATASRQQGPAQVAPNHVFVGESAITMTGEPRVQGGPGSSVRVAKPPKAMPIRGAKPDDGKGVKIAVLDTGLFTHPWLTAVQHDPSAADVWDVDHNGYADNESGHGTFIAGLILQIAPAAEVFVVKVLDSNGVGDDLTVATAMEALPPDIDIVNLSLGGYTDDDMGPLAIATALKAMRRRGGAVVAAAGNAGSDRPFWPAAFKQVLAVGAVEERAGVWHRASFSDYGWWVDAAARGVALQSTFARGKTKQTDGTTTQTIAFDGWASWDGTSFASPITAAMLARTMTREGLGTAAEAREFVLASSPAAPQPDFPLAVLVDEMA